MRNLYPPDLPFGRSISTLFKGIVKSDGPKRGGSKVYPTTSTEVMERRREEMLREMELNRPNKAPRGNRKRLIVPRWASTVSWELARAIGSLRKFAYAKNAD